MASRIAGMLAILSPSDTSNRQRFPLVYRRYALDCELLSAIGELKSFYIRGLLSYHCNRLKRCKTKLHLYATVRGRADTL